MNLETYPQRIVKPLIELEKTTDLAAEHKLLLDLGETLLTHITGIIFGEYKRNWDIDEALESEFYRNAKKKPSFGVFLGLLRLLMKADGKSVCDEYFEKGKSYPAVSEFVFNYNLLKSEVVNKGHDSGFKEVLEPLKKGRTVASKSGLDFFESFVAVRNTYAHPEEKAKNPLRNWPMGDEYYELINPLMKEALTEIISGFTVLSTHRPVLVKEIDDQQHKGSFVEEIGKKEKELSLELSDEELGFVNTNVRYLLDQDNKLFSKFYQAEVPQVNPSVAKQIIEKEKAKMMEPILVDMIEKKLEDGVIDELEYMVLKDTALNSFISEDELKKLITKISKELNLGEDIYISKKESTLHTLFNPYWIIHFGALNENKVEQSDDPFNTTNLHKNIWNQVTDYLEKLIDENLNNANITWIVKKNQFQIGNLSYTYWGQIYPENSPFLNSFNIGFAISKKFKWAKAKRGTVLWNKLNNPSLIIWPTTTDLILEKIDSNQELLMKLFEIEFGQLKDNLQEFTNLNAVVNPLQPEIANGKRFPDSIGGGVLSINDFIENINMMECNHCELFSPIWNIEDFFDENSVNLEKTYHISKEIVSLLTIFSNSIIKIMDYAIEKGINQETITMMIDRSKRNEKIFEEKIKQYTLANKRDKESMDELKQFAEELGLQKNQILMAFSRARWEVDKE